MRCFVYKSVKKDELYLYLRNKDDFSSLPQNLWDSIAPTVFIMELDLYPGRKLARADSAQVVKQLEERGFYVQMPPPKFPVPDSMQ